jgi:hypothetical protein
LPRIKKRETIALSIDTELLKRLDKVLQVMPSRPNKSEAFNQMLVAWLIVKEKELAFELGLTQKAGVY